MHKADHGVDTDHSVTRYHDRTRDRAHHGTGRRDLDHGGAGVDGGRSCWHLAEDPDTLVSFAPDGRYWIDTSGALAHAPDVVGTYELVGAETRFTETMDSADCEAGMKSSWHATVEDGTMTAEWIEHDCYPDAAGQTWELARVSPDIRWVPRLTEDPPSTFAADEGNLRGAWLIVGTSALIEFDGQGSYAWDDQGQLAWAPAETGTYQVENGTLELTVDSSTTCAVRTGSG